MRYRRLGKTGIKVSEVSLGSWLDFKGRVSKEKVVEIIDKAYHTGINFFDTANIYAMGQAEIALGEALAKYQRCSYVISTKVSQPIGEYVNNKGLSRKHIFDQVHLSLKRLGTEYIDVYYCHNFDYETELYETIRAMDDLIHQGKVLYFGVSEWTYEQIKEALQISDAYLLYRIVAGQYQYNMLNKGIEEAILPFCSSKEIAVIAYSPLAQGVLSGKYEHGVALPENSRANDPSSYDSMRRYLRKNQLHKVKQLQALASEIGVSLAQMSISWILRHKNISSALIGATSPKQVEENSKGCDIELDEQILKRIDEILVP